MEMPLAPQLKNSNEIRKVLKQIPKTLKLPDGRSVNTLLVYLPCQSDNKSSHEEFFKCVKDGILYNFVFSCSEVERKLGLQSETAKEELFKKALRKISQHTAKGELGELILFTLIDVYLLAPKLLSKISTKTSPRMPVFGADAVHGQFVNGEIRLYLGESKLHSKFKSAATDAVESIAKAKEEYQKEFDLLDSHIDFPDLNDELAEQIIKALNPYTSADIVNKLHSPCFIGFTQPNVILSNEDKYIDEYLKLAHDYSNDFFNKAEGKGLGIDTVTLFMLPFSCVDELTQEFIQHMGIEE